jgi:hypothetical protein
VKPRTAASRPKVVRTARPARPTSSSAPGRPEYWPTGRPLPQVIGVCVGLALLGLAVGVFSAFAHPQRVGDVTIGVPVTIAVHASLVVACGVLLRSRLAAGMPALGWMISILIFAQPRDEGDLVVPADAPGLAYLLAGLVVIGGLSALPYHRVPDRLGTPTSGDATARPAGRA